MNNVMRHRFTLREIVLLIVLIVVLFVGLYFLLVYYPIRDRKAELNEQIQQVEDRTVITDARLIVYNRMQDAIDEIELIPEAERTRMHKSTDEERAALYKSFGEIFSIASQVDLTYPATSQDGNVVRRPVYFSFTIPVAVASDASDSDVAAAAETAYEKCKTIFFNLTHNDNRRSLLSNVTLTPKNGNVVTDEISVSGTITYYEIA